MKKKNYQNGLKMIGSILKKLRINKKCTQEKVAESIGIERAAYSNYENDLRRPDYETLIKLSKFYNVSIDYLLGNVKKPNQIVVDELKDIGVEWVSVAKECITSGLTPEDIKKIIDIFKNKK